MSKLGVSRDEFLWLFPYAEIILCFMAQGENNGNKYRWRTSDESVEIMTKMEQIIKGRL